MARNLNPKCKMCRRAGEKLMLKGDRCNTTKCAMVKRNYPPGFHGPKGRKRLSDFGTQLIEKQKAKWTYDLLEKQFRLTFEKASKLKGNAGENLFKMLEMRLDNVIYRAGIADSRVQARQMVDHAHFDVNGTKTNIPSFQVKGGDIIKLRKSSVKNKLFKESKNKMKKAEVPGWLNVSSEDLAVKVLHAPSMEDINTNITPQMIVEFYSR